MEIDDIHIAIKSYKRAGKVRKAKLFPSAFIYVPESQEQEYKSFYKNVIAIPDKEDGNLCRKQNSILNRTPSDYTLILDDDISNIGYWQGGERILMNKEELLLMVWQGFILAEDLQVELWGINQNSDELTHYTYRPFNLLAPVLGPFHGHIRPTLRYDESVTGKDDYDFWLQNIRKFHKTFRMNKYHYRHDHGKMWGGFVSMRTNAYEDAGVKRMKEKWGSYYKNGGAAGGKSATGHNKLNSLIKVPIPGC